MFLGFSPVVQLLIIPEIGFDPNRLFSVFLNKKTVEVRCSYRNHNHSVWQSRDHEKCSQML